MSEGGTTKFSTLHFDTNCNHDALAVSEHSKELTSKPKRSLREELLLNGSIIVCSSASTLSQDSVFQERFAHNINY
eukprot:122542-Amphidinium_carterae.1